MLKLALSNRANQANASPRFEHRAETDPVFGTVCSNGILGDGLSPERY
jgi:hypothetical protein